MQHNPKVSILIPAKNESKFIAECLISIQEQTYKNWEAILVDDHSRDETVEIVKKFTKKDSRIKWTISQGEGIISALRTAYELSNGDFITRMDADDIMRPHKIETLLAGLLKYGEKHIAVGGVHYFSETKLKSGFKNYQKWLNTHTGKGTNFSDIFKECTVPSPCWMLFRGDLNRINAFNESRYPEDYDLAFRMYAAGYKVIPTTEIIHDWRDYATRTSRTSEHYKDYTFTAIKWHYFDLLHRNKEKQLLLLGTGYRGKKLAKHLIQENIKFVWISNNKEKIGKHIYDQKIYDFSVPLKWGETQVISTASSVKSKMYIEKKLKNKRDTSEDLFHFC